MGCEVVVFSGTNSKEEEAKKLGAKEFVAMKGVDKLNIKPVNHLVVTTSAQPDWKLYVFFVVVIKRIPVLISCATGISPLWPPAVQFSLWASRAATSLSHTCP